MMSAAERFIAGLIMIMLILGLYAAAVVNAWSFTGVGTQICGRSVRSFRLTV